MAPGCRDQRRQANGERLNKYSDLLGGPNEKHGRHRGLRRDGQEGLLRAGLDEPLGVHAVRVRKIRGWRLLFENLYLAVGSGALDVVGARQPSTIVPDQGYLGKLFIGMKINVWISHVCIINPM